jgi:hypothetical protein
MEFGGRFVSHHLPVLFACVDNAFSLPAGSTAEDAFDHPGWSDICNNDSLWMDTSRNWWHLCVAKQIAAYAGAKGLEFLNKDGCITISGVGLDEVISSLDRVLEALAKRDVPCEDVYKYAYHKEQARIVVDPEFLAELPSVKPDRDNIDGYEGGPGFSTEERTDALSFYCFLISLRVVAAEAKQAGKSLLWIIPPC